MAYATVADVQARMSVTMTEIQQNICTNLLDDAAIIIDDFNINASTENKKIVSIRMVQRALNVDSDIPLGATQGSMSAMGYSQSWTMGANSSVGELYLNKLEKQMLGKGNQIGCTSVLEYMTGASV
jgi:hypothetical protein